MIADLLFQEGPVVGQGEVPESFPAAPEWPALALKGFRVIRPWSWYCGKNSKRCALEGTALCWTHHRTSLGGFFFQRRSKSTTRNGTPMIPDGMLNRSEVCIFERYGSGTELAHNVPPRWDKGRARCGHREPRRSLSESGGQCVSRA